MMVNDASVTPAHAGDSRYLEVVSATKRFRALTVIDNLDFRVAKGELVSLLGPSGCGKTTLLRMIAGLVTADAGDIVIGGRDVTRIPAHKRNVSVVFQNYALFPHLNVRDNVAFGLKARGHKGSAVMPLVDEALSLVRMTDFAERSVGALSGGQQQRVAVARALVVGPDLLLLDEPFSALDRKLRETMQVELKTLLRNRGITAVFVTHDQEEALAVSHRIAVMNHGRIEQFAEPGTLYARPATPFVLDFVGLSTRLSGKVVGALDGGIVVETAHGTVRGSARLPLGTSVTVGVRPELMSLSSDQGSTVNQIEVALADVMCLGAKTQLHGVTAGNDRVLCELPGVFDEVGAGSRVSLSWPAEDTLIYETTA